MVVAYLSLVFKITLIEHCYYVGSTKSNFFEGVQIMPGCFDCDIYNG